LTSLDKGERSLLGDIRTLTF